MEKREKRPESGSGEDENGQMPGGVPDLDAFRDLSGRFTVGNPGGPGRPRKPGASEAFSEVDLGRFINAAEGPALWFAAQAFAESDEWLAKIKQYFPEDVYKRVARIVEVAKLAEQVQVRRLLRELEGGE